MDIRWYSSRLFGPCSRKTSLTQFNFFHSNKILEKIFNATFIALIPKKPGASEMKDFRPISLVGGSLQYHC